MPIVKAAALWLYFKYVLKCYSICFARTPKNMDIGPGLPFTLNKEKREG